MDEIVSLGCAVALGCGICFQRTLASYYYIGDVLVALACLGLFWVLMRKIGNYLLFPGTFWIFRKSLEINYSSILTEQIHIKLLGFSQYLQHVRENDEEKQNLYESNPNRLISTLVENFEGLEKCSKAQKNILNLLLDIKKSFEQIVVSVNSVEISFWNYLNLQHEAHELSFIIPKTVQNEKKLSSASTSLNSLLAILSQNTKKSTFSNLLNYFSTLNFGTLNYMKKDLENRFATKEFLINNVSSMFLKCKNASSKAVLICNPNAGFYEFIYFQSDWIEFYIRNSINVILWNYRGYGSSKGKPNPKQLIEDGIAILKHYQSLYSLTRLAVHGESIGGYIATHIACSVPVQFILADRTFGRLSDVILSKYGFFCNFLFKLTLLSDLKTTSAFLSLNTYKLIANDPKDSLIADFVSLKASVASNFILKQQLSNAEIYHKNKLKDFDYILSSKEYSSLFGALKRLKQDSNKRGKMDKYKVYIQTEQPEHSSSNDVMKRLRRILKGLDACGVFLTDDVLCKDEFFVKLWVMTLEIWGSNSTIDLKLDSSQVLQALSDLKELENEFFLIKDQKTKEDCQIIVECVFKLFRTLFECNSRIGNSLRTDENFPLANYSKAGCFMMVTCGHGGHFTPAAVYKYESHLSQAGFI